MVVVRGSEASQPEHHAAPLAQVGGDEVSPRALSTRLLIGAAKVACGTALCVLALRWYLRL
jgi:hypothetical protein